VYVSGTSVVAENSATVPNALLANSAVTINGNSVSLGGSTTVTAVAPNALTIGTGLSGTSYDGSAAVTVAIASTGVTAASVGSASKTLTATVNAQGQLTALADTNIAISNTQVSGLGSAALLTAGAAGGARRRGSAGSRCGSRAGSVSGGHCWRCAARQRSSPGHAGRLQHGRWPSSCLHLQQRGHGGCCSGRQGISSAKRHCPGPKACATGTSATQNRFLRWQAAPD
jgi:hypothetical protein